MITKAPDPICSEYLYEKIKKIHWPIIQWSFEVNTNQSTAVCLILWWQLKIKWTVSFLQMKCISYWPGDKVIQIWMHEVIRSRIFYHQPSRVDQICRIPKQKNLASSKDFGRHLRCKTLRNFFSNQSQNNLDSFQDAWIKSDFIRLLAMHIRAI